MSRFQSSLAALLAAALLAGAADGPLLGGAFFDRVPFEQSVAAASPYPLAGELVAGVVPHHLVAGEMIASFFATAAASQAERGAYETVVFVAPSHYSRPSLAVTTLSGFRTDCGTVENDRELSARLIANGDIAARADDTGMQQDHAVMGLIPYVARYLPQAKVAAVLLDNRISQRRADALAQELLRAAQERRMLLVCSIDFSHYLSAEESSARDEETRRAVEAFDYAAIRQFTDANMDSPRAMSVFLQFSQGSGIHAVTFFDHGNSAQILRYPPNDPAYRDGVTSYFILGAVREEG